MFERFTTAARDVVVSAQHEREVFGHPFVGTEHLLLGLLNEGPGNEGPGNEGPGNEGPGNEGPGNEGARNEGSSGAYRLLRRAGLSRIQVREDVRKVLRQGPLGDADAEALKAIGIDLDEVRAKVEATFGPGALAVPEKRRGFFQKKGAFSQRAKKVLELSLREAIRLHHSYLGPEHILLGLIREGDGLAAKIMVDRGVDLQDLREQVEAELKTARDVS